jgi:hypothetical protein
VDLPEEAPEEQKLEDQAYALGIEDSAFDIVMDNDEYTPGNV